MFPLLGGSNITFAPSLTAVDTPDDGARQVIQDILHGSLVRTGQPIAAVLAHSHGLAFVMCYTASYIFVSLGGVSRIVMMYIHG